MCQTSLDVSELEMSPELTCYKCPCDLSMVASLGKESFYELCGLILSLILSSKSGGTPPHSTKIGARLLDEG